MQSIFASRSMSFIRVAGVDGMQIAKTSAEWLYPLSPGEIGCFLSHKKCFELIASGDDEYGIILEDDVELSDNAFKYFKSSHWIPNGADVIKFETCNARIRLSQLTCMPGTGLKIGVLRSSHLGTAGYLVSKRAAKEILPLLELPKKPIDNFLFTPGCGILDSLVVYQTVPAFCRQSGVMSTINSDRAEWLSEKKRIRKHTERHPNFILVVLREIIRPVKRLGRFISAKAATIRTYVNVGQTWLKVPFE